MKIVRRISAVVVCYLLSSYGILLSFMLVGMSGIRSLGGTLVGMLILFAWVCHVMMSINWVIDKPVEGWVPVYGTLAGVVGLMLWPVADSTVKEFAITDILRAAAMGLALTLPCFLLAIYLVRFHLRAKSGRANSYVR